MLANNQAKNQITVSVEFHFKGEKITASVELDLDLLMATNQEFPNLYPLLASSIELDVHSYEYEMMQAEQVTFSGVKGGAIDHLVGDQFDFEAFKNSWKKNQVLSTVSDIADRHMNIKQLDQQPELRAALVEAYNQGVKNQNSLLTR